MMAVNPLTMILKTFFGAMLLLALLLVALNLAISYWLMWK